MSRNDDIRRILESRERAAKQNALQRARAKVGVIETGTVRSSIWPSNKRTEQAK